MMCPQIIRFCRSILTLGIPVITRQITNTHTNLLCHQIVCLDDGDLQILIIELISLLGNAANQPDNPSVDGGCLGLFDCFEIKKFKAIRYFLRALYLGTSFVEP